MLVVKHQLQREHIRTVQTKHCTEPPSEPHTQQSSAIWKKQIWRGDLVMIEDNYVQAQSK